MVNTYTSLNPCIVYWLKINNNACNFDKKKILQVYNLYNYISALPKMISLSLSWSHTHPDLIFSRVSDAETSFPLYDLESHGFQNRFWS